MAAVEFSTTRSGCYLGQGASLNIINEEVVILSGAGVLEPGTILGQVTDGGTQTVAAATAYAGNTGTGTVGTLTADAGAKEGDYRITIIEPAVDAGTFKVEDPDGIEVGTGTVGVAFNGPINFTISDATDFVAGDGFTVNVSYASDHKYVLYDPAGVDGREVVAGILFNKVDATSADVKAVATVRGPATINGNMLIYKSGMSAANKLAARNALRAKGMAVLPQHAGE